jgi:catechol 2,3-dioxygenase-like lactoylglutathione lyase family enzyme
LLKACHHHGFTVADVNRSVIFYRDVLGLELVRISERVGIPSYDRLLGYDNVKLVVAILRHPVDNFILELIEYVHPASTQGTHENKLIGAAHVAFEVHDVDALYAKFQAAGFATINPPTDIMRDGVRVARGMYGLDPDGISIELFEEYEDVVSK